MNRKNKQCRENSNFPVEKTAPEDLYSLLGKFTILAQKALVTNRKWHFRKHLLDGYFDASLFMRTCEIYNETYATCFENSGSDVRVRLFCIDPSVQMKQALKRCRAALFFSATLIPAAYFRQVLGLLDTADELVLPSPFPKEHLCVPVADRISTLYRQRDRTKSFVAQMIVSLIRQKKGNYLIYFPSYEYLGKIYETFKNICPDIETTLQTPGMTEIQREQFLDQFSHDNRDTLAGFAVMGGVFGEAIDLVGDRLTGAVIVGVGLPAISPERELIREYFQDQNEKGFEFAYQYPGINRVLQAAGRVIRSDKDRGVVLLIDQRFANFRYRSLLPAEWRPVSVSGQNQLDGILSEFWKTCMNNVT
jgi:DNA excision repair protein ERCC-2